MGQHYWLRKRLLPGSKSCNHRKHCRCVDVAFSLAFQCRMRFTGGRAGGQAETKTTSDRGLIIQMHCATRVWHDAGLDLYNWKLLLSHRSTVVQVERVVCISPNAHIFWSIRMDSKPEG